MKVGIIGAGKIGETLATRLVALGHEVVFANSRGPATLRGLADEIGAWPVTVIEAVGSGEIDHRDPGARRYRFAEGSICWRP